MTCVVILFVLAATTIVTWLALSLSERDMKSVIGQQQFSLLSVAAAHIDEQLTTKRLLLASIADAIPAAQRTPAAIQAAIERHAAASAEFANVAAFDSSGRFLTSLRAPQQDNPNVADRSYFTQTLAQKRAIISPPCADACPACQWSC